MMFFVWLRWKDSGSITCYFASADSSEEALAMPIGNRQAAIELGEAVPWPEDGPAPPNVKAGYRGSFRLRAPSYCDELLKLVFADTSVRGPKKAMRRGEGNVRPASSE